MAEAATFVTAGHRRRKEGDPAGAERFYRQALAADPASGPAARALAELLAEASRYEEAMAVAAAGLKRRPKDALLRAVLGRGLLATGQLAAATQALEAAVADEPGCAAAVTWLARCRLAGNRAADSAALLRPLLTSRGRDPLVRTGLGQACLHLGQRAEAVEHFREALALRPTAAAHSDLAWGLYQNDQADEAMEHFRAAAALDPASASAAAGQVSVLVDRGERAEAFRLLEATLGRGVADVQLLSTYARLAADPGERAAARRTLEESIPRVPGAIARSSLLLAMGTLDDADGRYDSAFSCFKAGNDLITATFDLGSMDRFTRDTLEVFTRDGMRMLPRSASADPRPIFIVGMPRSGTSLVEQILASHPAVRGGGEMDLLPKTAFSLPGALRPPSAETYPRCVVSMSAEDVEAVSARYLGQLRHIGAAAERVTDKMPRNFMFLGLIDLLFPGARVIHCVRDAMDTCFSCYSTPLSLAHVYRTRLGTLAAVYRDYERLMDHWRGLIRVPVLDVAYEDLVRDTEGQTLAMLNFLGLPWNERCLRFYENRRVVHTASTHQVRRPVYETSIGRWRHYRKHLGELAAGLGRPC